MKPSLLLLVITFFSLNSIGQQTCLTHSCKAPKNKYHTNYLKRASLDLSIFDNVVDVPLTLHMVRDDNGQNGLLEGLIHEMMFDLNTLYAPANMNFEVQATNYIDSTAFTVMQIDTVLGSNEYLMTKNNVDKTINIYFVPELTDNGGNPACGYATYPWFLTQYRKDWIIMDNDCAINPSTLAHEIGHYFSLYHTHERGNENVDGSNCGQPGIGDELCDTPADPNLRYEGMMGDNCNYTGDTFDGQIDYFEPDVNNIMSWAPPECRNSFSQGQIERIQQSYIHDRRSFTNECLYDSLVYSGRERDSLAILDLVFNSNGDYLFLLGDDPILIDKPLNEMSEGIIVSENRLKNIALCCSEGSSIIPCTIINLDQLQGLFLIDSDIYGNVPSELGKLNKLISIDLSDNKLTGNIPIELSYLKNLTNLHLSNNDLNGLIPSEIRNLSNLTNLQLGNNNLSGLLPAELSQLPLNSFNITQNDLSGCYNIAFNLAGFCSNPNVYISEGNDFDWDWGNFCDNLLGVCESTVFPGDFNANGKVDQYDIPHWGLAYNFTGSERNPFNLAPGTLTCTTSSLVTCELQTGLSSTTTSTTYTCLDAPQLVYSWIKSFFGINTANQDGDGNGEINECDLLVHKQNYGYIFNGQNLGRVSNYLSNINNNYLGAVNSYSESATNKSNFRIQTEFNDEIDIDFGLRKIANNNLIHPITVLDTIITYGFSGEVLIPQVLNNRIDTAYIDIEESNFNGRYIFSYHDRHNSKLDFSVTKTDGLNDTIIGPMLRVIVAVVGSPVDPTDNFQSLWVSSGSSINTQGEETLVAVDPLTAPVDQSNGPFDPSEGIIESNLYCVDELILSDTISFNYYQANSIESPGVVLDTANVLFHFQDSVILNSGFTVEKGAKFSIYLVDCL